tara:strand:- start:1427 stop:4042 length:2616 start_codon:yes stop_codon:yes gene_type:complete
MAGLGLVSPGIKVKEVDLTRGGITGVSDQTGAIAGPFVKGAVEDPQLIESEKDLVDTFGEPQETSGQYEYWLSAASYLSYGGVLRTVRVDGTDLRNANAAVATGAASSLTNLKIKNTDDYFNSYSAATTWYYASKNPGTWANGLKVCVIDAKSDQTLAGIDTAGIAVGAGITQAFGGAQIGGIGTSLTLNGHLSGRVTAIGAGSIDVKVVSEVAVGGSITDADYQKNGAYAFDTTRECNISGATGAATTSLTVTRAVGGTTQGAITSGEQIGLYNASNTTTIDNAGGAALGVSGNSVTVADATGFSVGSLLLIGSEITAVTSISGNAIGIGTRGVDGTTATAHNDGSTITVLAQAGNVTTAGATNTGGSDTSIQVVAVGAIDVNDYVRVAGVGTAGELMKVTAVTTNSALTPSSVTDWYEAQTLDLDNSTVYWNSVAQKPQTSAYANSRNSRFDEMHVVVVDDSGSESGTAGQILESWQNLSKAEDAKQFNSPIYWKDFLANNSEYVFGGASPNGTPLSGGNVASGAWGQVANGVDFTGIGRSTFSLEGGKDYGGTYEAPTYPATLGDLISGYNEFANVREYPINYLIQGPGLGSRDATVGKANKLIAIAGERKDCIAVVSPAKSDVLSGSGNAPVPISNTDTQTENILKTCDQISSSSYGVIDSGYKYIFDRFNNKFRYIPCNADVAGMMARTSQNSYPWFSPAGSDRGVVNNAVKLAYNPSQAQRDLLYTKRVNPVVAFPGQGVILFGDKTALSYVSAFDRINVRRLFLTIEQAIERAARAQLFEFNDDITRANFVNIVEPYLRDIQAKRGITDFLVVCDESNNTADVIDANEFRSDIFIKPARSINFIGLTFVATRTGISFEEVVGTV